MPFAPLAPIARRRAVALGVAVVAASSAVASADDFTWTIDTAQSTVTTTLTATTAAGTYTDAEVSSLAGTFGGTTRLPSYDFRQVYLRTADIGFTNNPSFFLGPGSFFGGVSITSSGLGFAIPGPNNLGFPGPGPVGVDLAGNFSQTGNGAEGRGTLTYTGTGLIGSAVGTGTANLVDVSPFNFDVAGTLTQIGTQIRLTVPLAFDETFDANGTPVRAQVAGTLRANATTTANGWKVDADGQFTTASNYVATNVAPGVAGSPFDTAVFGGVITADRTVTVAAASSPTLRRLIVDTGAAARGYTFAGLTPLRLSGNAAGAARIEVLSGVGRFDAPVQLTSDATVRVGEIGGLADAATARFGSLSSTGGADLRKTGPGEMSVRQLSVGDLTVEGGGVRQVVGGTSVGRVRSLTILSGSFYDVGDGTLIVDDGTTPTLSLVTNPVLANIKLAADANWPDGGITSSVARVTPRTGLGYGTTATTGITGLGGAAVAPTAVIVRFTRYGDSDLDLDVDFDDLLSIAGGYGTPGLWSDGDFDYDGTVGFNDLLRLASNYGFGTLTDAQADQLSTTFAAEFALAQSLVPEPGTSVALAMAGVAMGRRRRR